MIESYNLYKHAWVYSHAPHMETCLTDKQIGSLLQKGGWLVRNTFNFDQKQTTSFWFVIKDSFNSMAELSSNTRNQVRRGLNNFTIRIIDRTNMLTDGYKILCQANASYRIPTNTPSQHQFNDRITLSDTLTEFWGAFNNKNELVAFAINHIEDNCCNYQTLKAYPEALKNYVYYALIYKMNEYYLQNKKLSYVYDGARSITEHSNIQQFLIQKFNFRKAYCSIKITYCWWLKIAVKIIYPFRTLVNNNSVTAILRQEAMQRNQI
ncbi:MAG: hypothetical protein IJ776_10470 [Paludibacteraceae bacterium]|nr:hypothetical protein [Paludibacteraceae bacterium]